MNIDESISIYDDYPCFEQEFQLPSVYVEPLKGEIENNVEIFDVLVEEDCHDDIDATENFSCDIDEDTIDCDDFFLIACNSAYV